MKFRTILVDDERKALELLENKLQEYAPEIELISKTQSPIKALELIKNLKPDIVIIDIAMPELSGFDVLNAIENPEFEIIFVTAFDQYAIQAIQHSAIAYLLKPFSEEELVDAVNKAKENRMLKSSLARNQLLVQNLLQKDEKRRKIAVPSMEGLSFIKLNDILYFEGSSGYTKIHCKNSEIMSSYSIGYYLTLLNDSDFFQVHKSYLVNSEKINKYVNEGYIILADKHKIPVSKPRRQVLVEKLRSI